VHDEPAFGYVESAQQNWLNPVSPPIEVAVAQLVVPVYTGVPVFESAVHMHAWGGWPPPCRLTPPHVTMCGLALHWYALHIEPAAHMPHVPPHPSGPHCLPTQFGWHALPELAPEELPDVLLPASPDWHWAAHACHAENAALAVHADPGAAEPTQLEHVESPPHAISWAQHWVVRHRSSVASPDTNPQFGSVPPPAQELQLSPMHWT
jgi:hypothetical protein